jgi:hypothetical protein
MMFGPSTVESVCYYGMWTCYLIYLFFLKKVRAEKMAHGAEIVSISKKSRKQVLVSFLCSSAHLCIFASFPSFEFWKHHHIEH